MSVRHIDFGWCCCIADSGPADGEINLVMVGGWSKTVEKEDHWALNRSIGLRQSYYEDLKLTESQFSWIPTRATSHESFQPVQLDVCLLIDPVKFYRFSEHLYAQQGNKATFSHYLFIAEKIQSFRFRVNNFVLARGWVLKKLQSRCGRVHKVLHKSANEIVPGFLSKITWIFMENPRNRYLRSRLFTREKHVVKRFWIQAAIFFCLQIQDSPT